MSRPRLGVLKFSDGSVAAMDGPVLIGRNPPSSHQLDGETAAVVAIDDSELSRLHAAVHVSEWQVLVADQGSTNGTIVRMPGQPSQTLRPFEKVQLPIGSVVDLGGAITFSFDVS